MTPLTRIAALNRGQWFDQNPRVQRTPARGVIKDILYFRDRHSRIDTDANSLVAVEYGEFREDRVELFRGHTPLFAYCPDPVIPVRTVSMQTQQRGKAEVDAYVSVQVLVKCGQG